MATTLTQGATEATPWMSLSYDDFNAVFQEFRERQQSLGRVKILVKGGENKLPAKTLLRYYQMARDVDMATNLCNDLFLGKEILFTVVDASGCEHELHQFVFGGGDITEKFNDKPWLLDVLFDMAQGLLVKKLMPPSFDFGIPESGLAESESPITRTT